jgi:ubiquinol-cytochrome c reductase iron-sulfur subunit
LANVDTLDPAEPTRRDFIHVATGAAVVVGSALTVWPIVDQMNPDAAARALSQVEVDIASIQPGMTLTVQWRGKPVFIRNRTEAEIAAAQDVPLSDLPDQNARNANLGDEAAAFDDNRAVPGRANWLITEGVCTHLGCVPLGEQGEFGGWFCPCHGSVYDTAGRVRRGPAPQNLNIPPYEFISETRVRIG